MIYKPTITPEEFEEMSGVDHMELVDGELREKGMGIESSFVQSRLNRLLGNHVEDHKLGMMLEGEAGYRCFPHRPRLVRKPDISFVRNGRFPNDRPPLGYTDLVPDLVIEVLSPNDSAFEVQERLNDFLLVQVPAVWMVDPHTRTVQVFRPDGTSRRLTAADELTGDPVLPGFRVRVADLFPPPLPDEPEPATN
jgi:Uma2 family endonuclease